MPTAFAPAAHGHLMSGLDLFFTGLFLYTTSHDSPICNTTPHMTLLSDHTLCRSTVLQVMALSLQLTYIQYDVHILLDGRWAS